MRIQQAHGNCKYCGTEIISISNLTRHENVCQRAFEHKDKILHEYVHDKLTIKEICKKYNVSDSYIKRYLKGYIRTRAENLKLSREKYPNKYKLSNKTRKKLSELLKENRQEHPEKYHQWRGYKESYPEKRFREVISEYDEYIVEQEKPFYPYFADFTILNAKVVIEIDGGQHNQPERKAKDKLKEELIISKGYRIMRFPSNEVIYETENVMKKLEDFVNSDILIKKSDYVYLKKKRVRKKKKCLCGNEIWPRSSQCKCCASFDFRKTKDIQTLKSLLKDIEHLKLKDTKKYNIWNNSLNYCLKVAEAATRPTTLIESGKK